MLDKKPPFFRTPASNAKSNSKSFTVKSYFDKKTISFQNDKNAEIKDFDQFKIVNISLDSIQELRKKGRANQRST